jgi:predicted MFS family arabinose efflux permease
MNLAALIRGSILLAAIPLAAWGIAHTALVALSSIRVTLAGKDAAAFAMTLNISAANLGIAVGAVAGGWVIDGQGLGCIGLAPIVFAAVALAIPLVSRIRVRVPASRCPSVREHHC